MRGLVVGRFGRRGMPAWLLACSLVLGARPSGALAAVFTVDRADDLAAASACDDATPDDCSLRGAVARANVDVAHDTVVVPSGTYLLDVPGTCTFLRAYGENFFGSTVALCLNGDVDVTGAGAELTTIQSSGADRVFAVSAGRSATIAGVTITGGVATFGFQIGGGGGILNHGTLAVSDCVLSGNRSAGFGGAGIYNRGVLTVTRSRLVGNITTGPGGAINNNSDAGSGILDLVDSTLSGNDAVIGAGLNNGGQARVLRSTIASNSASSLGGGLNNGGAGKLDVVASTISGNQAFNGGGIQNGASSPLFQSTVRLASTTITGNHATYAGGISHAAQQTLTLRNTIVAGNTATTLGPDCLAAQLTSEGHNLVQDTAGCPIAGDTTGNVTGLDAALGPLADTGGPTATHALLAASPAIDAGDPAGCTDLADDLLATDQRGAPRSADGDDDGTARCDIGATELGRELGIAGVLPREGGDGGPLIVVVNGSGFESGATVKLVRSGQPDVVGDAASVGENGGVLVSRIDLGGAALGVRDVVVTNPDGTKGTAIGAFTIAPARAPELWIDVLGPSLVRVGRSYRYLFRYGNRGNSDAFAVPLLLSVAENVGVQARFTSASPPELFGETVIQEWGRFYQQIIVGENPELRQISLVLPVVPAGFSGVLELGITVPFTAENQPFAIRMEHGQPMYDGGPDAAAVARLVAGARDKSERLFKYTLPTAMDGVLTAHLNAQLETIVASGVASLVESFGAAPRVYSLSQLGYELAAFGYVWSLEHPTPPLALLPEPGASTLLASIAQLARGVADLCVPAAHAQVLGCGCGAIPNGQICCPGCSCSTSADKDPTPPKTCLAKLDQAGRDDCKAPRTPKDCRDLGFEVVEGKDGSGAKVSICTNNRKCVFPNAIAPSSCLKFPVDPRVSHDPNDKSGPLGGGAGHFIGDAAALAYTIQYENKPAATAPAAEVVITDQLDPDLVDLATLTFGPLGFGDVRVVPPPGATAFARDVDLRPAKNLIVRIDARLDTATALVTWRLTALDPATMEIPDDPLLGFLPPNLMPPEGDGHVSFSIAARPGLTDGTEIANQARIFFDLNDPIDTPVWRNVVDATPPASSVTSVVAAGACAQDLDVAWSGSDAVAGIGAYSILVSEDAGPFVPWIVSDATAGRFTGKWGRSYAFRSVAEDLAGNVEDASAVSGVSGAVAACGPFDLAVTKIGAPRTVKLTARRPARGAAVKVQIQNRSAQAQVIADETTLAELVGLQVESLGACATPRVALRAGKPQRSLPIRLGPKKKVDVVFDVVVDCANDGAKGAGHADFRLSATVNQAALGGVDAHPDDDACPRQGVKPALADPYPDGKLKDAGCGARQAAGTLGGPVLLDVALP